MKRHKCSWETDLPLASPQRLWSNFNSKASYKYWLEYRLLFNFLSLQKVNSPRSVSDAVIFSESELSAPLKSRSKTKQIARDAYP